MPLIFKEIIDANVTIGVWKITETEAELRKELILSPKDQETILSTRLLQRRLERIACRRAIASLLGQPEILITYGEKGEPFLPHYHISFSHTKEFVAVAVSAQYPVGVDIEKIQEKILGLHSKFVSEKELTPKELESSEAITRIWTSKEAVYKLFQGASPDFKTQIFVKDNIAEVLIHEKKYFAKLENRKIGEYICSLATEKL